MGEFQDILLSMAVSLGIGLLIGLEREWAHKDVGLRTFALAALAGDISWFISPIAAYLVLGASIPLLVALNARSMMRNQSLEMTTSIALLVTLLLGMMVAKGYMFVAVAAAIVMTMLLAWKAELVRFAGALTLDELRSVVLFGMLSLVVYPVLPQRLPASVDPMGLVNIRAAWLVVVVLSAIGLVNYVLLRLYGLRGIRFTGILGGLVNSTATVAELAQKSNGQGEGVGAVALEGMLLANIAMVLRNGAILGIFAPRALLHGWFPVGLMLLATVLFALSISREHGRDISTTVELSFPFSLRHGLLFGLIYLAISVAAVLAKRYLGSLGFFAVTTLGGLASSASTSAAAATLAAQGRLTPEVAGLGVVLASMASLGFHVPVARMAGSRGTLLRRLFTASAAVLVAGFAGMVVEKVLFP